MTGERCRSQASATCPAVAPWRSAGLRDRARRLGEVARGEREPRDEADALLLAVRQDVLGLAVREVVEVLHRGDRDDLLARLDLLDGDLRQADVPDLAASTASLRTPNCSSRGTCRVDPVQLPERDDVELQAPQAHLQALAQVLRAAERRPLAGARAGEAGLRGDHGPVVGGQRLGDEVLRDVRAVGVGRVDEVDAELGQPPQDGQRGLVAGRRPPDAVAGDAHRAVAEAGDLEVPADLEGAGSRRRSHRSRVLPAGASGYRPRARAGSA
jgi:hypothetical protein